VTGTAVSEMALTNLDEGETAVYQQLRHHNWRLEQERISQADVKRVLAQLNQPTDPTS
jgi:phage gp45-like